MKLPKGSRDILRVLSNINNNGKWGKTSDLPIVLILQKRGLVKYTGRSNKLYIATKKGKAFLKKVSYIKNG